MPAGGERYDRHVGKLAARLIPVLGLVACSWPVMVLASLLGGIDPLAVAIAFAIILAVAAPNPEPPPVTIAESPSNRIRRVPFPTA